MAIVAEPKRIDELSGNDPRENYSTYDEFGNPKVNKAANLTAHALLGAAIAIAQGNSALAGGAGALAGEAAADFIREKLYNKDVKDLSEADKENISALAQLAVGLAVAAGTGGNTNDVGTAVAGSKNAVENNNLAATVPIIKQSLASLLGVQNLNQVNNDQLALSIEKSLKGLGVTISDTYDNLTSEQKVTYLGELVQELSDEDKAKVQYQYKIDTERNQIAMGNRPKVDSFNDYLATNEYGKGLSDKLTQIGVDAKGNPIYQATGSGYGNYIWGDSYVTMDSGKDTLLVYSKDGSFQAALNLDGTINETLTGISKGGSLPTIVDKPIQNHTGGNQIQDPLPPLPGFIPQESLVPNNTGHGDGLDNIEIKHDTGGNQLPEIFVPNTGGEQIIEKDWRDNILISESRPLTPDDLGIKGKVEILDGTITTDNGKTIVRIEMIEGEVGNPLAIINNLIEKAKNEGSNKLVVEGTLANEKLLRILEKRYGMKTKGGNDSFEIDIK
ncbi:hypothetical protein GCM10023211_09270 [Orbus sasakiae]|uniref:VENN motif-containing domain-containing protein n=1 Tax=Orbus sasakiae TaxID=1078475 RepID=A0ABP9N2P9_9GAMM